MAHGQPDFGAYAAKKTVFGQADMAEMAVRLGSVVSYDRRGDVVFIETFEGDMLNWREAGGGTGHAAVVSPEYSRNGAFSCKLTTGSTTPFTARVTKYLPPLIKSKVGLEVHWTRPASVWTSIYFRLIEVHDDKQWDARIRYLDATGALQYWDGSDYQNIATGIGGDATPYLFLPIKFVIDLENDVYHRLVFHNVEYDLTDYAVPTAAGSVVLETKVEIRSEGESGYNVSNYIDDVILTQNEP